MCVSLVLMVSLLGAGSTPLVTGGQPSAVIIVPREPSQAAWFGAGELRRHVEQLTGAVLPVLTDDQTGEIAAARGTRVLVGDSAETRRLGLRGDQFGLGEYLVRVTSDTVVLLGRDQLALRPDQPRREQLALDWQPDAGEWGSLLAVYHLLENTLGVRWYAPGAAGTWLPPKTADLSLAVGEVRRHPAFPDRRQAFGVNFKAWGEPAPSGDEVNLWHLRNRLAHGETISHSFERWPKRFLQKDSPEFESYHPEYFAVGREPIGGQLCFSNPATIAQVVQDARDYFDGKGCRFSNAGDGWVGLVPRDIETDCKCPNCQALMQPKDVDDFFNGSASRLVWTFTDRVARELLKTHPDKYVAQLAYFDYSEPPKGLDLAPNILVGPAIDTRFWPRDGGHQYRYYKEWARRCPGRLKSLWLYPCFPIETATAQGYHSFPVFEARRMTELMRMFAADGVRGFMICGLYDHAFDAWLYTKLLDDPTLDPAKLQAEFFPRWYGAAAGPMTTLYNEIEKAFHDYGNYQGGRPVSTEAAAWDRLGTDTRMAHWGRVLANAEAAAATDTAKQRVAHFRATIWQWMTEGKKLWTRKKNHQTEVDLAKTQPPPSAEVGRCAAVADGDPARVDWAQVPILRINRNVAGYPIEDRSADLQLVHDGQRLYARLVDHLDTKGLYSGEWFWGDRWEWFLSTQRDKPYRQVGFYIQPRVDYWSSTDEKWGKGLRYQPAIAPQSWTLLWSLPLSDVSAVGPVKPGDAVYMNFIRGVRQEGGETLAFSPTFEAGRYHNLPRMAEFRLAR